MELSMSGNSLKTFSRSIISLSRIGSELVLHGSSSQLLLHCLNTSRSAYQSISFTPSFFDSYSISSSGVGNDVHCGVLLKSVCAVLRTPPSAIDRLSIRLPSDAIKLHFSLRCLNGITKTYCLSCNADPDVQHLSIDKSRFPSLITVRPRDLTRLLANFQSSLHEITVIATEQSARADDYGGEIGGKAVELRSYIDPTKDDGDMALHTQLWIDPAEEFLQYTHAGDPVDVTFGVKELKAFLSFCEGCEADIQIFFEKAGEPILMAPRFGFDGASNSDFDATLVLASMLVSQLNDETTDHHPAMASNDQGACGMGTEQEPARAPSPVSDRPSNHTKIWSDLTAGSAAKSSDGTRERHIQTEGNPSSTLQNNMQNLNAVGTSKTPPARENFTDLRQAMETVNVNPDEPEDNRNYQTQHHPSNWVGGDDDEEEEDEVYVQSTPHFYD
ncbi:cell cycle checkpoint control protein RAD9A [Dioscorea cayenensis subsp. rotundata]|uniref:Cell cycle checkpoint control protein RAD9A n=1 Tax=Dioscorea cayennensis subsp. rotundata TaxID=55577 RepID=A0AB40BQW7_DIOCR|nr:cell cycle checkpoint control protein RAD9A [Dioscorea cayenensis subsp. rotundata]